VTVSRVFGRWHDLSQHWALAEWHAARWESSHTNDTDLHSVGIWKNQNRQGILGEFVYCFETGLIPDLTVGYKKGADFKDGTDVKTNHELWGHLLVLDGLVRKAGVSRYALVIVDDEMKRGVLVGTATPELVESFPAKKLKWKPVHRVPQEELTPWQQIPGVRRCPCSIHQP